MDMRDMNRALRQTLLENDLQIILKAFDEYASVDVYPSIMTGMYSDAHDLYDDIITIIRTHNRINDLLEMTPYVDDYIETYFDMCQQKN
jgi:hypothetical protein